MALEEIDTNDLNGLALHLKKGFTFWKGSLLDESVVLIKPNIDEPISPGQANKHIKAISHRLHLPTILVLDKLASFQRSRYIQARIPFVVPGQQLYIPKFLLDLRSKNDHPEKTRSFFRPATQCMILYHLLVDQLDGARQEEIAERLHYSTMTISRAIKECRDKGLINEGRGPIVFKTGIKQTWDQSKAHMQSPVGKNVYTNNTELAHLFLISGLNALAHYTDIAGEKEKTYAMSTETYRSILERHPHDINEISGDVLIEVWDYDPRILSAGNVVDPLSLFLTMQGDEVDERTSKSLEKLIELIHDKRATSIQGSF